MKKCFVLLALVAVWSAGCAPALKDLKPALAATDSGGIWFASCWGLGPDSGRVALRTR